MGGSICVYIYTKSTKKRPLDRFAERSLAPDTLPRRVNLWTDTAKSAVIIDVYEAGAGGGTRTHTTFYGPRILSPVRLPFRHTGNLY